MHKKRLRECALTSQIWLDLLRAHKIKTYNLSLSKFEDPSLTLEEDEEETLRALEWQAYFHSGESGSSMRRP